MNYIDLAILLIIAFMTIRGLFRGLITELMILVAIVLGFTVATVFHPQLQSYLMGLFPNIPQAGAKVGAFITIFIAVNVAVRIFSSMLNKVVTFAFLQPINKAAGAVFAFAKITLIISVVLNGILLFPGSKTLLNDWGMNQSITFTPVKQFAPWLKNTFFPNTDTSLDNLDILNKVNSNT